MKQAHKTVRGRDLLHDLHGQLVVVGSNIGSGINGSQFVLCRSYLVMLRLCQDTQLPQLLVQILHKCRNSGLDHTKVVVIHFLPLGRLGTKQGPAGIDQVLPLVIHFLGNKEVLLFRTNGGADTLHIRVTEQLQDPHCLPV